MDNKQVADNAQEDNNVNQAQEDARRATAPGHDYRDEQRIPEFLTRQQDGEEVLVQTNEDVGAEGLTEDRKPN